MDAVLRTSYILLTTIFQKQYCLTITPPLLFHIFMSSFLFKA